MRSASRPDSSGGVDSFFATIYGQGGHGASPHTGIDPIYITGHVLLALHGIVSRRLSPFARQWSASAACTAGRPRTSSPTGSSFRAPSASWKRASNTDPHRSGAGAVDRPPDGRRLRAEDRDRHAADDQRSRRGRSCLRRPRDLLGAEHVLPSDDGLGAEDFGCFSEVAPGAMFSLGCKIEGDERLLAQPALRPGRALPAGRRGHLSRERLRGLGARA